MENNEDYLAHHGILGQKWGVRRYQNEDGTLTAAGRKRYAKDLQKKMNKNEREIINNIEKREINRVRSNANMKKGNVEKAKIQKQKQLEAEKAIKKGESLMWKYVADSIENGYNVRSLPKQYTTNGALKTQLLVGPLGYGAVYMSLLRSSGEYNNQNLTGYIKGAKYKVYDNGPNTRGQAILTTYR